MMEISKHESKKAGPEVRQSRVEFRTPHDIGHGLHVHGKEKNSEKRRRNRHETGQQREHQQANERVHEHAHDVKLEGTPVEGSPLEPETLEHDRTIVFRSDTRTAPVGSSERVRDPALRDHRILDDEPVVVEREAIAERVRVHRGSDEQQGDSPPSGALSALRF